MYEHGGGWFWERALYQLPGSHCSNHRVAFAKEMEVMHGISFDAPHVLSTKLRLDLKHVANLHPNSVTADVNDHPAALQKIT